ncbi:MAG TPA: hypothetical protein VHG29_10020 [Novosphingobium sp.]|nr:hypothetical protein [Novosphingobium sp.]
MSRSRRKTPIFGHTTADTDHRWKKAVAHKLRRRVRQHLSATLDGDRFAGKRWDLDTDWSSDKDGKRYAAYDL